MSKTQAAVGSAIWFVLAPGVVAGLVPWLLTRWEMQQVVGYGPPLRALGGVLVLSGVGALLHAFTGFVVTGRGTPAPAAPTEYLVVTGLYRYVRNPMYLAVLAVIVGQAMIFAQVDLFWYTVAVTPVLVTFVHAVEEPALRRTFGSGYDEYRQAVRPWWPRLRPWAPAVRTKEGS